MFVTEGFEAETKIHIGSDVEIYRGRSTADGQPVIIKYIPVSDELSHSIINIKNEYEIINYLDSNAISRIFRFQREQKGFVLVLEDIGGVSLKDYIQIKPFNLETYLKICIRLADILSEIHKKKVIHKDIKSDNIIFNEESSECRFIDFGISTRLSKEETSASPLGILEGSLQYISPEQTGRMNRALDYRTDFYSLGVTFYELFTGKLPFESEDPLELIHYHLAKNPASPAEINSNIPEQISKIILKLMEKTAEDRYQTAFGLKYDLEKCLEQLQKNSAVFSFALGEKDISDEFRIPQKLYGRDKDIENLLNEFKTVLHSGQTSAILIGGYSGAGKSSLIREINKPITEFKGYFLTGKYDQYNRNMPFSAIIQIFSSMVKIILADTPEEIAKWKIRIQSAVGKNGKVVTDVIPELEFIIGQQPELPELGPAEEANRFNLVFQKFVSVLASKERPIAIFLDDLQWADSASLGFIKILLTEPTVKSIFLIFAYRDNETDDSHPFIIMLDELRKENIKPEKITLKSLSQDHIQELLSDTLRTESESVIEFAKIVTAKTGGNPFFVNELLKHLYRENGISFHYESNAWIWDLETVRKANISENVVDLLIGRIRKLSNETQEILKFASCIGSELDLGVLSKITGKDPKATDKFFFEAIREELVVNVGDNYKKLMISDTGPTVTTAREIKYKFQHDKVQQASYELLSEDLKKNLRLTIGRILIKEYSNSLEEKIFEIVNHLNIGFDYIEDRTEKKQLIEYNILAAKKAKASTAYKPALYYIMKAAEIAEHSKINSWKDDYSIIFEIYKDKAELEYLNGNFDQSENDINVILENSDSAVDKAAVYKILIMQYTLRAKYKEAMVILRKALSLLGVSLPEEDLQQNFLSEVEKAKTLLGTRLVSSLISEKENKDREKVLAVQLLTTSTSASYLSSPDLWCVIVMKTVNLFLEYGNRPESYGYSCFGILQGAAFGNFKLGYEYSNLAYKISEKFNNASERCKAANVLANLTMPWVKPLKECEIVNKEGLQDSLNSGEYIHGGYITMNAPVNFYFQGKRMEELKTEITKLHQLSRKMKSNVAVDNTLGILQIISNLTGETTGETDFDSEELKEEEFLEACGSRGSVFAVCIYKIMKAQLLVVYGKYEEALSIFEETKSMLAFVTGIVVVAEHNFYYTLALAALYPKAKSKKKKEYYTQIKVNINQMKIWAESCPENFLHKLHLQEAELSRIRNHKPWKTMELYDKAIEEARKNEFIQCQALACELSGNFWNSIGKPDFAENYLVEAFNSFRSWGAVRKVEQMKDLHPFLRPDRRKTDRINKSISKTVSATEVYTGQNLDMQSVIKSANAISGEIQLDSLLQKLLNIVIENAGAQKGILVLKKDNELYVEAASTVKDDSIEVLMNMPLKSYTELPQSLIYYAERTRQNLVLHFAYSDERFNQDAYIIEHQLKSVMCAPIIQKGELSGIIYLENNLTEGAFTPSRLQTVNILAAQAAISIDNAMLYANMEQKVRDRTKELALANDELATKNQHITESIEYSLTIQQAILPSTEFLNENLKEHFLLYLPKDIVAGDFYWCAKTENSILIAVADCTGHGVPGALMSMIGMNFLGQIVNEKHIHSPGIILEELNQSIRTALRQNQEGAESRDGMDICLVKIEDRKVTFAGAKRPLYINRNGKIETFKGDLASIGGRQKELRRKYSEQVIDLSDEPDKIWIYLTTDGYVDQPDSERNRIGTNLFTEILLKTASAGGSEQLLELNNVLTDHRGTEEQRDDITVMGISL